MTFIAAAKILPFQVPPGVTLPRYATRRREKAGDCRLGCTPVLRQGRRILAQRHRDAEKTHSERRSTGHEPRSRGIEHHRIPRPSGTRTNPSTLLHSLSSIFSRRLRASARDGGSRVQGQPYNDFGKMGCRFGRFGRIYFLGLVPFWTCCWGLGVYYQALIPAPLSVRRVHLRRPRGGLALGGGPIASSQLPIAVCPRLPNCPISTELSRFTRFPALAGGPGMSRLSLFSSLFSKAASTSERRCSVGLASRQARVYFRCEGSLTGR